MSTAPDDVIADLRRQLQAATAREAALAEVLALINRSPGDPAPVFDLILDKALLLCDASFGDLSTYDGEFFRVVADRAPPGVKLPGYGTGPLRPEPGTTMERIEKGERLVHIAELAADDAYRTSAVRRALVDAAGMHSLVSIALRSDGMLRGALHVWRRQAGLFPEPQIALLENFAAQAVIAIDNARLLTEQREALEQQTATAEVFQVINGSPGDVGPVFDSILEKSLRLCDSAFGSLHTFDGEVYHTLASRGMPPVMVEMMRTPLVPVPGMTLYRITRGEDVVQVADLTDDDVYRSGLPSRLALADLAGARTQLLVALRKDGTLLGVINVFRQQVRPFSGKQIALLRNFAAQAVIAMENARLLTEQREALEQQTATAEVLQVINANPGNLAPVFDAVLERALRLCEASFGTLLLYNGETVERVALLGIPPAFAEYALRNPLGKNAILIARGIATRKPVLASDVMIDMAASPDVRDALVQLGGVRALLQVPLLKDGEVVGFIAIFRAEPGAFPDKQITLLESFAAQAVIAMENARLITEQREALEQQTATAEVLQVINASPGDLAPVFAAILGKAHSLCGAAIGSLMLYDGEYAHAAASQGFPEQHAALVRQPYRPGDILRGLIRGERLSHILDHKSEEWEPDDKVGRSAMASLDIRTGLRVPLRKDSTLLGWISAYRLEVRPFSEKEIALLENFAAQAVIAMENARLITEQREALEQQTATAEVLGVINANPGNLAPVFDAILQKAHQICGAAIGSLLTYDGEFVRAAATHGFPDVHVTVMSHPTPPNANFERLRRGERCVHIPDVKASSTDREHEITRSLLDNTDARTSLVVPLRKNRTLLGAITAYRLEVRPFSEKEIALLENFAAQAVIAMENARLLDELRQRQEELRITFENMGDGVAMFDRTPRLVAWNHKFQEMLDVPDDILTEQRTYADYIRYLTERGEYGPNADPEAQLRGFQEHMKEHYVFERTRPDGRVMEVRHNPVQDGGFVLIYADITERKRNEKEIRAARDAAEEASRTIEAAYRDLKAAQANLIQAEKMASLGQLTAGIAHEIKNPLNFVNNFADLSVELLAELKETAEPGFAALDENTRADIDALSATLTSNLEKIVEHGKRADGIVKAMLEHSRGASAERRVVDINALVEEALNLAYHGARAQDQSFNITLERDFAANIALIELNPQDITRVCLNLISNGFYAARKQQAAAGPGFEPCLRVSTRDLGDGVEIRVRDNGTGVPDEIRDKLFQPFFTTKPTGEGTGLGLSISYDIVTKAHGGTLAIESMVGAYTEFVVTLPRKIGAAA